MATRDGMDESNDGINELWRIKERSLRLEEGVVIKELQELLQEIMKNGRDVKLWDLLTVEEWKDLNRVMQVWKQEYERAVYYAGTLKDNRQKVYERFGDG